MQCLLTALLSSLSAEFRFWPGFLFLGKCVFSPSLDLTLYQLESPGKLCSITHSAALFLAVLRKGTETSWKFLLCITSFHFIVSYVVIDRETDRQ